MPNILPDITPSDNSYYLKMLTGYDTDADLQAINNKYSQPVRYIQNKISFCVKQTVTRNSDNASYVTFIKRYVPAYKGIKKLTIKEEAESVPIGCAICGSCTLEYVTEDESLIAYLKSVAGITNTMDGYLKIETGISSDGGNNYDYYPMGVYKVINLEVTDTSYPGMERPKLLKIEAFDDIYFLNKEISTSQVPIGSLYSIINDCVSFAYDPDTVSDLQLMPSVAESLVEAVMYNKYTDTINIRDIVASRAAALGKFIKCDKLGQLQLCRPMIAPVHYNKYPNNKDLFEAKIDDDEKNLSVPVTGYMDSDEGEIGASPNSDGQFDTSFWHVDNWYAAIAHFYNYTTQQMAAQIRQAIATALPLMEDHDQPYNGNTAYYPVFLQYRYKTGTIVTRGDPTWTVGLVIYFSETGNIEPTTSDINDLTNFYTHRIIISSIEFDLTGGMKATIVSKPPNGTYSLTAHSKYQENVQAEDMTLSDGTHAATITAQDAEVLKNMAQIPRKLADVPIYNKTDGLVVPGTLNPHYHSADGLSITSESEYATEPCIVNLNLENVKQLRVVFQRNDGAGTGSYNSMGEFTIPLDYSMPNRSSRTTYGEWFIGGTTTITARDTNRLTCAMASVFYPTGGSLADCSFAFNDAWTLYGTARTSVSNLYVVAIYACY